MKTLLLTLVAATVFATPLLASNDEPPSWLREIASRKTPDYGPKVSAVTLFDEEAVTVNDDGSTVSVRRWAVKILTKEGRDNAIAAVHYRLPGAKLRDLRAWLIFPSGENKRYGKEKIVERSFVEDALYADLRTQFLDVTTDAGTGSVFGYESTLEEKTDFTQIRFAFQHRDPVLLSRVSVTVPSGWQVKGTTFQHEPISPVVSQNTYTWEVRDLAPVPDEPHSPAHALSPRLAISYFPSSSRNERLRSLTDWKAVSTWMSDLEEGQGETSPLITAKVRELTANAKSANDRIKAIARYVQSIRYVSIQTDVSRAGGYRPHAAAKVMEHQYGDCKDKANLMRTMLKVAGIDSYMVSIYSGDRNYVRPEWPSPQQFNHAIIAVQADDSVVEGPLVTHPEFGRLIFFDPTDPVTTFGDLPWYEQGSFALIDSHANGDLVKVPTLPPSANMIYRESKVTLGPDGSVTVDMQQKGTGQAAHEERSLYRRRTPGEFDKFVERWIARSAPGARIDKLNVRDTDSSEFDLSLHFTAPGYAKVMRNSMLVFRPSVVSRRRLLNFGEQERKLPVEITAETTEDVVRVQLPDQFKVDELPPADGIDTPFGSFRAAYEVKGKELVYTRTLQVKSATVQPESYKALREFFGRLYAAENAPVVLMRE